MKPGRACVSSAAWRIGRNKNGEMVIVATNYDLLMAQYGVPRGLPGQYPADYNLKRSLVSSESGRGWELAPTCSVPRRRE